MHPRQARLLVAAETLAERTAAKGKAGAPVLFKYFDEESGKDFYLPEKKTTVKSPWSGKSLSVKPEKFTMGDVGKELKSDAKAKKAAGASVKDVEEELSVVFGDLRDYSNQTYKVEEGPKPGTCKITLRPGGSFIFDNAFAVRVLGGLPDHPEYDVLLSKLSRGAMSKEAALLAILKGEG